MSEYECVVIFYLKYHTYRFVILHSWYKLINYCHCNSVLSKQWSNIEARAFNLSNDAQFVHFKLDCDVLKLIHYCFHLKWTPVAVKRQQPKYFSHKSWLWGRLLISKDFSPTVTCKTTTFWHLHHRTSLICMALRQVNLLGSSPVTTLLLQCWALGYESCEKWADSHSSVLN